MYYYNFVSSILNRSWVYLLSIKTWKQRKPTGMLYLVQYCQMCLLWFNSKQMLIVVVFILVSNEAIEKLLNACEKISFLCVYC